MKVSILTSKILLGLAIACCNLSAMAETPLKNQTMTLPTPDSDLRLQEEAVQWVPHAVTVLKQPDIEETFRRDLEDIESIAPGLIVDRMNTTPRGAAISIRGLGSAGTSKAFDPAVAVNVDGVYVGTHTSRLQVLFDFEEIEVVRGPNTFEANPNVAGSINIKRPRPHSELDVKTRASVGINQRREADVVVNTPVVEGVNARVGIYWKDRGGEYMKNVFNERQENSEDYTLMTASIGWDFRDLFELTYTFDAEKSDETTPAILNISAPDDLLCSTTANLPFPNCRRGVGNPELDSVRLTAQNFSNKRQLDGNYHTLKVSFDALDHEFTSITGYRNTDEINDLDLDASNADFYHVSREQEYEQISQEITVTGQWDERLSYRGGLYFLDTQYSLFQQERHILKQLGDAGLAAGAAAGAIQELTSHQESTMYSVFAHADYVLNDQWTADFGFRWSEVDRDFDHSPSRIRLGDSLSPLRTLLKGRETTKQMLISGGFAYKVDEAAMIYLRYSEGFLPGGFDENAMSAFAANSYGAETSRTGEIGLKSNWWDDRLRVNVTYYKTELDNKVERFDTFTPDGSIESILDNVSQVEIGGWEFEIESTPLENLYLRTSYSNISADYNIYTVSDLSNPGATLDRSSLTPSRAPQDNLYVGANYSIAAGPGTIHVYAGYRLFSDYQTYPLLPEGDVKNWSATDLSISYEYQEWQFRLFSQNVKNKEYIQNVNVVSQTDILPVGAGANAVPSLITHTEYNQPRYTGLEVIYRPDF